MMRIRQEIQSVKNGTSVNPESQLTSTLVAGLGNILLCDEGLGVQVIEALKKRDIPGNVELLDVGNCVPDLLGSV